MFVIQRGRPWRKARVSTMLLVLLFLFSSNCFITRAENGSNGSDDGSTSIIIATEPETGDLPPEPCNNNTTLTCGENEIVDECPSYCPSDFCPTGDKQNQACPRPKPCPPPACKCKFNHRRAQNGKCILTRECPPFTCDKPNEEFNSCPPLCPNDSCSQATPTGECPYLDRIRLTPHCRPSCRCKEGYWRNNGTCVPYNQCPGKLTCGPNEVVDNCPADCPSDYCPTRDGPVQPCKKPCQCPPPACKCAFNHRRAKNGTCIPTRECPPFKCNEPNQVYNPCPSLCPSDDGRCPTWERIGIVIECNPTCRCKENYWKKNGTCVPYNERPRKLKCAPGEVIDNCPVLCNTEYCPKDENDIRTCYTPIRCLEPACRCPFNHLRAANETCIPASSCPPIKCTKPHEVYNSCPPACPSDDCKDATLDGECPVPGRIGVVVACKPGCRCEKSYWRQNGTCVPFGQCDPEGCFGDNEHLSCVPDCPPPRTCRNREIMFSCTSESQQHCEVKCVCKQGFYRNSNKDCVRPECCDN